MPVLRQGPTWKKKNQYKESGLDSAYQSIFLLNQTQTLKKKDTKMYIKTQIVLF